MRLVGRADLDERGAALVDAVRQAERPADLDQLPPRHDDLATVTQRRQQEQRRRRVVVDHQRRLGPRQPAQQPFGHVLELGIGQSLEGLAHDLVLAGRGIADSQVVVG